MSTLGTAGDLTYYLYICLEKPLHVAIRQLCITYPTAMYENSHLFFNAFCVAVWSCDPQTKLCFARSLCQLSLLPASVLQQPFLLPGPFPAQAVPEGQCCWLSPCLLQGSPSPDLLRGLPRQLAELGVCDSCTYCCCFCVFRSVGASYLHKRSAYH